MKTNKVCDSCVEMTEIVMPGDTNSLGTIFGGKIMQWMDIAAAICGFRHCRTAVVTASVDSLSFLAPVRIGDIVSLRASVNFTANTSMEIGVRVEAEEPMTGFKKHASSAYFTFVSVSKDGKPMPIKQVQPETEDDKRRFDQGKKRRLLRLQMRGKK
jgi:acyl-CoA hydrolase